MRKHLYLNEESTKEMGVIFEIILYLIQIAILAFMLSMRYTWRFIKFEFGQIRWSFRQYPFAFFSFIPHVLGYLIAINLETKCGIHWLVRFYSFGFTGSGKTIANASIWPFWLVIRVWDNAMNWGVLGGLLMFVSILATIFFFPILVIVAFECVFCLFPLLHAIVTQLVLGILLRPLLNRWRQWRSNRFFEKVHKRSKADPELQAAVGRVREQMDLIQEKCVYGDTSMEAQVRQMGLTPRERLNPDGTGTGIMEVELPMQGTPRKQIREFDATYQSVYDRICEKSMKCYQVKETLREMYGEKREVERMYSQMLELHYEMIDIFSETYDLVCFSKDGTGIPKAYEEFKRSLMRLKNAQQDFDKAVVANYGERMKNDLLH